MDKIITNAIFQTLESTEDADLLWPNTGDDQRLGTYIQTCMRLLPSDYPEMKSLLPKGKTLSEKVKDRVSVIPFGIQ